MRSMGIEDFINAQRFGSFQIRIAVLCFLVMLIDGFDAQAVGFVAPAIVRELHIDRLSLGPIFTAGVIGMTVGSLSLGMLADRFGRKRMLVLCLLMFGLCTMLKATAGSVVTLIAWQFLAGLGLGGAYPNAVSMMSEFSPASRRATLTAAAACGYLVGTSIGGFVAAALIPAYGWQAVFLLGGALALVLTAVLLGGLPESAKWLLLRAGRDEDVMRILRRIADRPDSLQDVTIVADEEKASAASVSDLFVPGRAVTTVLLWIAAFMSLLVAFFVFTWLPTVFTSANLSIRQSVIASTMIPTGAVVGSILWGVLVDRRSASVVLGSAFALYAVCLVLVGVYGSSYLLLILFLFLAGVGSGGQTATNAYIAMIHPTLIRSTAVGWAIGVGRVGSILGPLLGTFIVGWSLAAIFMTIAIPAAIAAISLYLLGIGQRQRQDAAAVIN